MKELILTIVLAVILLGFGFLNGFEAGKKEGYKQLLDDQTRIECESQYGNVSNEKISGNCLKYFIND